MIIMIIIISAIDFGYVIAILLLLSLILMLLEAKIQSSILRR